MNEHDIMHKTVPKIYFDLHANIHSKFSDRPIANTQTQQLSYIKSSKKFLILKLNMLLILILFEGVFFLNISNP